MSLNATLANSARRIRAANLRLPVEQRVNVADEYRALLHRIDGKPDGQAARIVNEWTLSVEQRLALRLLNSPLDDE